MSLTLSFRGLCAFVYRSETNKYEILLNPTGGHHKPALTVFTEFLKPETLPAAQRWVPDFLGYVPVLEDRVYKNKQLAIWNLEGIRVLLPSADDDDPPPFPTDAIYLDHGPAQTVENPSGFGIVELRKWNFISKEQRKLKLKNGKNDEIAPPDGLATEIECTGLPLEMYSKRGVIRFGSNKQSTLPRAVISNVATEPTSSESLMHFRHYYDIVTDANGSPISPEEQFLVEYPDQMDSTDGHGGIGPVQVPQDIRTDEVYDCVPPAGTP